VLDAARTGGPEIEVMRGLWSELQNSALERAGEAIRVDHRSLEAQREAALARGDALAAEELTRTPEIKLGRLQGAFQMRQRLNTQEHFWRGNAPKRMDDVAVVDDMGTVAVAVAAAARHGHQIRATEEDLEPIVVDAHAAGGR
jgi:hypothetical protein